MLLFARPANGVYLPPKVIRLDGKSTVEEIGVVKKDMPNFFVEAVTIADGRVYTETKEIVVPPEKRVLNVDIEPSKEAYKPGEKAKVKIKLTDFAGKPFVGSTVVAIYDKSVEYISGGSNVPEIKEFFWKWRRQHNPQTESSLGPLVPEPHSARRRSAWATWAFSAARWPRRCGLTKTARRWRLRSPTAAWRLRQAWRMRGRPADDDEVGGRCERRWPRRWRPRQPPMAASARPASRRRRRRPAPPMVQPTIRTKFADTALWVGALDDRQGRHGRSRRSTCPRTSPPGGSRSGAWATAPASARASADVVTRKDLIIRLEAPRFFVQTDEVVLSAIVHNYLKTKKKVQVALELSGNRLAVAERYRNGGDTIGYMTRGSSRRSEPSRSTPNGEARVDWRVKVLDEGEAVIRMKALTDEESDAMEQKFPCYIHGMLKTDSYSGAIRPKRRERQVHGHRARRSGGRRSRGSKSATRPRWPARWSMPCRTWSIILTAAPSRP